MKQQYSRPTKASTLPSYSKSSEKLVLRLLRVLNQQKPEGISKLVYMFKTYLPTKMNHPAQQLLRFGGILRLVRFTQRL